MKRLLRPLCIPVSPSRHRRPFYQAPAQLRNPAGRTLRQYPAQLGILAFLTASQTNFRRAPASESPWLTLPPRPVRLKDIANDLNVSVMTVSKVVRGCADVGAETRSRVLARIKELNYQPNWVARSLAARRTFMIGLIVPDLMHSFFAEIAKGVSTTIRPLGYDVVICNSEEDSDVESSEVDRLLARQVDGLMLASAQPPSSLSLFERIEARGVPYVLIDRRFSRPTHLMSAPMMKPSAALPRDT